MILRLCFLQAFSNPEEAEQLGDRIHIHPQSRAITEPLQKRKSHNTKKKTYDIMLTPGIPKYLKKHNNWKVISHLSSLQSKHGAPQEV